MARDSTGPKGQPIYDTLGVPADAADLTELGEYAALVGNRKAMTATQRNALSGTDRWVGLEVEETDTGQVWVYTSGGWAQRLAGPAHHAGNPGASITGVPIPGAAVNLPRGLLIKTGAVTSPTSVAFGNEYFSQVTFATPFPTALLAVFCTSLSGSPTNRAQGAIAVDTADATRFRAFIEGSGTSYIRGLSWLAVGY